VHISPFLFSGSQNLHVSEVVYSHRNVYVCLSWTLGAKHFSCFHTVCTYPQRRCGLRRLTEASGVTAPDSMCHVGFINQKLPQVVPAVGDAVYLSRFEIVTEETFTLWYSGFRDYLLFPPFSPLLNFDYPRAWFTVVGPRAKQLMKASFKLWQFFTLFLIVSKNAK
jgi:hypothetical protein